eukprot:s796_g4.t1
MPLSALILVSAVASRVLLHLAAHLGVFFLVIMFATLALAITEVTSRELLRARGWRQMWKRIKALFECLDTPNLSLSLSLPPGQSAMPRKNAARGQAVQQRHEPGLSSRMLS